jgi:hypothetical protein
MKKNFYDFQRDFSKKMDFYKSYSFSDLLKEEKETHVRHFSIDLRLAIDDSTGGGIEDKLIRIRSIDGVTIVSPQENYDLSGAYTIRVKFHPQLDSMRPVTYIRNVLVPQINSAHKVPGVRVLGVLDNTFKRLN